MRNQMIILATIAILCVCTIAEAKYCGGTGEPNDPYIICSAESMNEIGTHPEDWDKCFILVNDINLADYTGTQFNIIGNFSGVFDGNDHKIWNFTWSSAGGAFIGLFKSLGSGGQIKNLGMENVSVSGGWFVGGLVGNNSGTITNCYITGNVTGRNFVGGLVFSNSGTITNCYSTGNVSGVFAYNPNYPEEIWVGGLVADNSGTIMNCYSTGSVTGTATDTKN